MRCAACCDIGGTKVLVGLVDEGGAVIARDRYPLGGPGQPDRIVRELKRRLAALLECQGMGWGSVVGVGCSVAAMADIEHGVVLSAPNLLGPLRDIPFADLVKASTRRPTLLEMDAYAAALGEDWYGVGRGVKYFVYVVVGTGIGAGILKGGQVYRGWHGTAGEFGHVTIIPGGPPCNCGRYGCLEALASGPAIALRAQGMIRQGRKTVVSELAAGGEITPEVVFEAARQGDSAALDVVAATVTYLGIGIANLMHLLNPEVIGLGGGVIRGGADLLMGPLRDEVARRCGSWVDVVGTRLVVAALGEDAALLGVARKVWQVFG